VDQWDRAEAPEINPHSYSKLTLNKVPKTYLGEKIASLTNGVGKPRLSHVED
jgi:hypothetical protein